jgi:hypothetical protein
VLIIVVVVFRRNVHVQNFLNNLQVVEDEDKLYAMSLASQAPSNAHPDQPAPGTHFPPSLSFFRFRFRSSPLSTFPIAAEPEAQTFAEDMIATGRTTAGFSHNRPFLPNDNPDETRVRPPIIPFFFIISSAFRNICAKLSVAAQDDISEAMSSSFLDITTTTTTEASTLERVREMIIIFISFSFSFSFS